MAATAAIAIALLSLANSIVADSSDKAYLERVVAVANATRHSAYRAHRRLEGGLHGSNKQGWLEVWTESAPGVGLTYEVTAEGGHDYIRKKILRDVLKGEQKLVAGGQPTRPPLLATNYRFSAGGTSDGLLRILLTPLRKAHGIVNGALLVDPADGRPVQIAGRLEKNPSFWVRDVDVSWRFERIGDEVLPVEMTSTARVRLFGMSSFRMVYDYVSVDGHSVASAAGSPRRD